MVGVVNIAPVMLARLIIALALIAGPTGMIIPIVVTTVLAVVVVAIVIIAMVILTAREIFGLGLKELIIRSRSTSCDKLSRSDRHAMICACKSRHSCIIARGRFHCCVLLP